MKLKRLGGLGYRGHDFDGKALHAAPGEVLECSDRRGAKLLADYPGGFEVVAEKAEGPSSSSPVADGAATTSNPVAGEGDGAAAPESPSMGGEPAAPRKRGRPRKVRE